MRMNPLYDVPVEATVDGIRFLYDGGEVEVDYNASDDDVVRLTIEPLEVKVTDGFRAAVKACKCDSSSGGGGSGGSTGGGVLIVNGTITHNADESTDYTIDKTWKEIKDAGFAVLRVAENAPEGAFAYVFAPLLNLVKYEGEYFVVFDTSEFTHDLATDNENGYPSHHANQEH